MLKSGQSRPKPSKPSQTPKSRCQPQVKTISIFIKDIDNHIQQSYQHLRQASNRSKRKAQLNSQAKYQDSLFPDNSSTFDNTSKFMMTSSKKQRSDIDSLVQMSKDIDSNLPITLIDNQQVKEYINLVYDLYNIPDPMTESVTAGKDSRNLALIHGSRRTMTGTPVLRKKSSASSFKDKIVKHRDIDLNHFHSNRKQSKQSIADISLLSTRSKGQSKSIDKPIIKLRHTNAIPQTNQINHTKTHSNVASNNVFTEQTFRYCFACQAAVLQANLKHHQQLCRPLQVAMGKSIEELVGMLENRIDRLKRELRNNFVQSDNDPFFSQYNNLKKSVGQWLTSLTPEVKQNRSTNKDPKKQISSIHESWDKTFNSHFERISRLNWFSRLRQNLKNSHNI